MYIKSIIDELKKGSIKTVLPIGYFNEATNTGGMTKPYVLVYDTPKYIRHRAYSDNGYSFITIMAAFPPSYQQALDKYIMFELFGMLDNKVIEIENGDVVSHTKVSVTDRISQIITDTSDGYIARERVISIPYRWR